MGSSHAAPIIILYNKKITMYMNILSHEIPSAERRYPGSQ